MKKLLLMLVLLAVVSMLQANPVDPPSEDTVTVEEAIEFDDGYDSLFASDSSYQTIMELLNESEDLNFDYDEWWEQQQRSMDYLSRQRERQSSNNGLRFAAIAIAVIGIFVKIVLLVRK